MDSIYIFNPSATSIDFLDAIDERLTKALAITNFLLSIRYSDTQHSCDSIHNAIWAVYDYLAEAIEAQNQIIEQKLI